MTQPQASIQDTKSTSQLVNLYFNRNQYMTLRYFGVTTNNTQTELFADGLTNNRVRLPDNSITAIRVMGAIYNVTDNTGATVSGVVGVRRTGSALELIPSSGSLTVTGGTGFPNGVTVAIAADTTNNAFRLNVTGVASTQLRYEFLVELACATATESNYGRLT